MGQPLLVEGALAVRGECDRAAAKAAAPAIAAGCPCVTVAEIAAS